LQPYKKLPINMSPRDLIVKKLEEHEKRQMSVKAKLLDGLIQDPRLMITTCEKQNPFKDYYPQHEHFKGLESYI